MNGFQKHGIVHTSPSSINLFCNAPDVYVAEKLFGMRGRMSPAAMRGIVIEQAIVETLMGASQEDATAKALAEFHKSTLFNGAPKVDTEREMIAPAINMALGELKKYGTPDFKGIGQDKIELVCRGDGWELPVIGYTDIPFTKHGLIVDIKTTARIPSVMSPEHKRQRAIYKKASGNMRVAFLYVSGKKTSWLEPDDEEETLQEVKAILNRQERFLRLGDRDLLKDVVHHDRSSFYWNNDHPGLALFG